jgi:hypothetical protein
VTRLHFSLAFLLSLNRNNFCREDGVIDRFPAHRPDGALRFPSSHIDDLNSPPNLDHLCSIPAENATPPDSHI